MFSLWWLLDSRHDKYVTEYKSLDFRQEIWVGNTHLDFSNVNNLIVTKFYETLKEVKVDKSMSTTEPLDTPTLREQEHEDEMGHLEMKKENPNRVGSKTQWSKCFGEEKVINFYKCYWGVK